MIPVIIFITYPESFNASIADMINHIGLKPMIKLSFQPNEIIVAQQSKLKNLTESFEVLN